MILVDTSVWVDHFRNGNAALGGLLSEAFVLLHPFVIGELSCGNLKNRAGLLRDLNALPLATQASHDEVLRLMEEHRLSGSGIGWIDAHLLASAMLSHSHFWTMDGRLEKAAKQVGLKLYCSVS